MKNNYIVYIIFAFIISNVLYTQENPKDNSQKTEYKEEDTKKERTITVVDPVVVTSTKPKSTRLYQETPVNVIDKKEIEEKIPQNTEDLLRGKAGIDVSHSGAGISRPMIRGLHDSRVLLLADGIRISELRHGGNHALSVDLSSIEKIEILRGASSVIYGSDALGGVMNFITFNRSNLKETPFSSDAGFSYDSASNGKMAFASLSEQEPSFGYKVGAKIKDTDNIETPDGKLPFSFHDVKSGFGNFYIQDGKSFYGFSGSFLWSDIGVPVLSAVDSRADTRSKSQFEGENHTLVHGIYERAISSSSVLTLDLAYQNHNRHMRQEFKKTQNRIAIDVATHTLEFDPKYRYEFSDTNTLITGMQNIFISASSKREVDMINPGAPGLAMAGYDNVPVIPDSIQSQNGIFLQDEWKITNRWFTSIGARYDVIYTQTDGHKDHIISKEEEDIDHNVSASFNLEYFFIPEHVKYNVSLSRSFRAPILSERYFDGPHQGGNDKGNPDIDPEIGYNTQGTLKVSYNRFSMEWGLFYNYLTDYIEKVDIGNSTDEYRNVSRAHLYGTDADFNWNFYRGFSLFGNITVVRAENLTDNENLSDIPPVKGRYGARFDDRISSKWRMWHELSFLSAATVQYPGPREDKTAGYTTMDYYVGFQYMKSIQLSFYVKNLMDKGYHDHLSRINPDLSGIKWEQPGRSFGAGIKYTFTTGKKSS